MPRLGTDITQSPQPLDDVVPANVVITMGHGDGCSVYPGKRYLNWDLNSHAGKITKKLRPIRDDIDTRVREEVAELIPTNA